MKIAFYMEDGLEQIVLTPETDTERAMLEKVHAQDRELSIRRGQFYECRGGFVRHGVFNDGLYGGTPDGSTMIVLRPKMPVDEQK